MTTSSHLFDPFLSLHRKGNPLLLANAWDTGSARVLASLGYSALATTSAGHAGTLGRQDGGVSRDEALEHARVIAAATELPVSADFENGFADTPEEVAEAVGLAGETGLAGLSVEDWGGSPGHIYPADLAAERVAAAAEAAARAGLVLTARCENFFRGVRDLGDTIARLQAYAKSGAHVVYAPGLTDLEEIRQVVEAVEVPVNVLCMPGGPDVGALASVGVARISVGSGFYNATLGALAQAGREWLEQGTHDWWQGAIEGMKTGKPAFR